MDLLLNKYCFKTLIKHFNIKTRCFKTEIFFSSKSKNGEILQYVTN